MKAIYKRELGSSLNTLTGYIFCVFVLLFAGIYCSALNIKSGYSHFEYVLNYMAFIFIIAIPILTMRTFSEEFRQGTIRLLYSLPISSWEIVLGKFLAVCTIILVPTVVLSLYPLVLTRYGAIPLLHAYGALTAFYLLSVSLSSIGLFISSLTENSSAAACISFAVLLFFYYGSSLSAFAAASVPVSVVLSCALSAFLSFLVWRITGGVSAAIIAASVSGSALIALWILLPESFALMFKSILEHVGVFEAFYVFVDGVFDLSGIVYFLSIISAAIFFTVQVLEKRRQG